MPESLENLYISRNKLKDIPTKLPDYLDTLHADDNYLSGHIKIKALNLRILNLDHCNITELELDTPNLELLRINNNKIKSLNFKNNDKLKSLICANNNLKILPNLPDKFNLLETIGNRELYHTYPELQKYTKGNIYEKYVSQYINYINKNLKNTE